MKLLTGGGLGDAVMAFAKLHARYNPADVFLTHVEVYPHLIPAISSFYQTQDINCDVFEISSWNWKEEHEKEYDDWLFTSWDEGWEIDPFPPLKFDKRNVNVVISPLSGRNTNRGWSRNELLAVDNEQVIYIGTNGQEVVSGLKGKSLIGQTTMKEVIDLICSANTVIAAEGFVAYLGAMAGNQVYVKRNNVLAIQKRKHPNWKLEIVDIPNV
jgi:hypothetical protein